MVKFGCRMRGKALITCLAAVACGPATFNAACHTSGVILIVDGQSNAVGADSDSPPSLLPDSSIPIIQNDFHYDDATGNFAALDVSPHASVYSHEIALARAIKAAGYPTAVIKLVKGATFSNRWIPSAQPMGANGSDFFAYLQASIAKVQAQFPAVLSWKFVWVWDQGEEEIRYGNPTPSPAELAVVDAWPNNFALIKAGIEAAIQAATTHAYTLDPIVIQTWPSITNGCNAARFAPLQASVVSSPARLIQTSDLDASYFLADGVHRKGTTQTNVIAARAAAVILPWLPSCPVTALS